MNDIPNIFDADLLSKRRANRANKSLDFITQLVLDDLSERLQTISRPFSKAFIMAPDCAGLPSSLHSATHEIFLEKHTTLSGANVAITDTQFPIFSGDNYQLIISLFDMAIINDVPGFLNQIAKRLAPDGLFIAAFIGGTSLSELRAAWLEADAHHLGGAVARVAPFIDIKDAGALLQRAGLALPVVDKETLNLRYANPLRLMTELKQLGASNPLVQKHAQLVTKGHLASANKAYAKNFSDADGRVRATLEIIWMSGWGPHDSQQNPLKPGSADISLTKILGKNTKGAKIS